MYHTIPNQRIPFSQKGPKWRKENMDAYLSLTDDGRFNRKNHLQRLYDYYNGVIYDQDYAYVLKPYGKARKNFPSQMRNYPIIKPTVDLLLGEKAKRPFNYSVITISGDAVDRKEQAKQDMYLQHAKQMFVNELNAMGVETGEESQEVPLPKDLEAMFERTYVDNRAIIGQKSMTYIMQNEEVHEKFQKAWFHFCVTGEVYTERGVRNGEPFIDVLNPLDVDYDLDPDLDYVEDGDWAIVNKYMNPSSIVERWGKLLTDTQIDQLYQDAGKGDYFSQMSASGNNRRGSGRDRLIWVRILYWQSLERKGFLTYTDPTTGSEETIDVEDGFTLDQDLKGMGAKITWEWQNREWQGVRIGNDGSGTMDIDIRPTGESRTSINGSKNKLSINGRRYSDINSENISLVMLGIPYQLNYNVIKYRLETSLARSKDIIAQLDINLIPKNWDMDKFMYYVEGTGIAWVDYNKEGVKLSPNHQSVLDLSIKTITMYIELLRHVDEEWERVSGVNRQRKGEISQYEGKAMGQQAIVQSAHTTEDMYRKFAGVEKRDLQALLDYSKHAWKDGKKSMFIMPDGRQDFLDINPKEWMESELGIFISDATKDVEKINIAREVGQGMINKGAPGSMVLDMINEESFITMLDKLKKAEKELAQSQNAAAQADAEARKAEVEWDQQKHKDILFENEKNRLADKENLNTEIQGKKDIELMKIQGQPVQVVEPQKEERVEDKGPELALKARDVNVKEKKQVEDVRRNKATEQIARSKPSGSK